MVDTQKIEYVVVPPDGGWGWVVVFCAFISNSIVDGSIFTFGIFLDAFCKDFKASASLVSVASSLQTGVYFILGPVVCAMINRLGFRIVAVTGGLLGFSGILAASFITNVYLFISIYGLLLGVGFSMTYLANILVVGFYFEKWRPLATCIAVTGTAIGVSCFPVIFNILLEDFHWRMKYRFLSGALLLVALLGVAFKPIMPTEIYIERDEKTAQELEEKVRTRNIEYPTSADIAINQPYTIISPAYSDSRLSFKSLRSYKSTKTNKSWRHSFDLLDSIPEDSIVGGRKCKCLRCRFKCCPCLWHGHRPMYRDDIMYQGSVRSLPVIKGAANRASMGSLDYNMAVTRTSSFGDILENADCCNCCPASVRRVLFTMMDPKLLKSISFVVLVFSGFMTYLGLYTPYILGVSMSESFGTPISTASYVLSTVGISNGVGRIGSGLLTLIPNVSPLILSQITLFLAGSALFIMPIFADFWVHLLCAAIFGFNIATISSLRTVICVDMNGLDKLTNSFGLVVMFEGIASLISIPLNVWLYESTNKYFIPFYLSGVAICVSALLLIPIKALQRMEKRVSLRRERKHREKVLAQSKGAQPSTSNK